MSLLLLLKGGEDEPPPAPSSPPHARNRLVARAISMGAALLYAPRVATDPLENLGYLDLPDGELINGASLLSPGLIGGGSRAELSGSSYIETFWEGAFENGTARTFVSFTRRNADGAEDTLVGSSHPKGPRWVEIGSGFWTFSDAGINNFLGAAWPVGEIVMDALVVDQSTGDCALYRDGELLEDDSNGGEYDLAGPPVAFSDSFETGDVSKWDEAQEIGPTASVSVVKSSPTPSDGEFCLRCELKSGDERAEVYTTAQRYSEGVAVRYAVDLFIPEGFPVSSNFQLVWQLHQNGAGNEAEGDSPPARLTIVDGEWRFEGGPAPGTPFTVDWDGPPVSSGWHAFEIEVMHSQDPAVGYVEVTHNGAQQTLKGGTARRHRATLPSDSSFNYLKAGYYRDPAIPATGWIGVDAVSATIVNAGPPTLRIGAAAAAGFMDAAVLPFLAFEKGLNPEQIQELWRAANGAAYRVAVQREYPPDQLMWRVKPPAGSPARWAADEPDPANVIEDTVLIEQMPGGRQEASGSLSRDPREAHPDQAGFSDVEISQPGGEVVWDGRLEKVSEASGERRAVKIECAGWGSALEDDKAVIGPAFIDGDLTKWGEPSTERRQQLSDAAIKLLASTSIGHSSADLEAVLPAIINDFNGVDTVATDTEAGEAHYFSGGVDIGEVRYDHLGDLAKGVASADYESNVALGTTDTFLTAKTGTDHDASAASDQSVVAPGDGYQYARIRNRLAAASEGVALKRIFGWYAKVLGRHGLIPQGTWPDIGFTAKQMLEYAIPLHAPPLEVNPELIEDDGFVIPQAWFAEPGPISQVVDELTRYGLMDWFVRGKLFQLRRPGTYGRVWKAFVGPSGLEEVGEDAQRLWESIIVRWQDVDGTTRTAGPPGSGAQIEDERLRITDPDHPAVKAPVTRRDLLDLQGICTAEPAIAAAEGWLAEANELNRAGRASFAGYLMDDKSVMRPVAQILAGDHVVFVDSSDPTPRKIVAKRYEDVSKTTSVDLDAPPGGIKALLERYRARLIRLGIS